MLINILVFWVKTQCRFIYKYQRFGGLVLP